MASRRPGPPGSSLPPSSRGPATWPASSGRPGRSPNFPSLFSFPLLMTSPPIEAEGLRKVYRSRFGSRRITALDGVSLRVEPGQVFGLLGPNGAGKTTIVKILLGLTHATDGQ